MTRNMKQLFQRRSKSNLLLRMFRHHIDAKNDHHKGESCDDRERNKPAFKRRLCCPAWQNMRHLSIQAFHWKLRLHSSRQTTVAFAVAETHTPPAAPLSVIKWTPAAVNVAHSQRLFPGNAVQPWLTSFIPFPQQFLQQLSLSCCPINW